MICCSGVRMPIEKQCCVAGCYAEALFGEGVNLLRGVNGRWRCWPHHKEYVETRRVRLDQERAEKERQKKAKTSGQGDFL